MDELEQKILTAADQIKQRDAVKARIDDALGGHQYMIRWNRPSGSTGTSYDGILVSLQDVEDIIRRKLGPISEAQRQLAEDEVGEVIEACQPC